MNPHYLDLSSKNGPQSLANAVARAAESPLPPPTRALLISYEASLSVLLSNLVVGIHNVKSKMMMMRDREIEREVGKEFCGMSILGQVRLWKYANF
ncbi:hypothetical protein Csa_012872 [Cucumis sativus]|uniref:Uncharacterized protein n=1 Tax=Cucumis sativus TaxID=3659 RepID=A0A0A0L2C1_CUCSA|nr:hypothetical protein Csa_012872 [Cucumis sativus]